MRNYRDFMELLRQGRFYEAHEALEELWFPRRRERSAEALALKGFINAAVALELCRLGREANARRVWKTYLKYRPLIRRCGEPAFLEMERCLEECYERYLS